MSHRVETVIDDHGLFYQMIIIIFSYDQDKVIVWSIVMYVQLCTQSYEMSNTMEKILLEKSVRKISFC